MLNLRDTHGLQLAHKMTPIALATKKMCCDPITFPQSTEEHRNVFGQPGGRSIVHDYL